MSGIVSYGAYIPAYRLSRDEIARQTGRSSLGGARAVANFDEDSLTMAVSAGIDCLTGFERGKVDGLYFAATTAPYREKQSANIIAGALDLRRQVRTADFSHSLRSGASALKAAMEAVADSNSNFLVLAADSRPGVPQSDQEQLFGDAAAALMVGNQDIIASIDAYYSHSDNIHDFWRLEGDKFVKSWEDRFIVTSGFTANMQEAVMELLKRSNLTLKDINRAVIYAPDGRSHQALARGLGLDLKSQVVDPLFSSAGNCGSASAMLMLAAALEVAKPGEKILFASYGDGVEAFILSVTPQIEKMKNRRGVKKNLAFSRPLATYQKYLALHKLLEVQSPARPPDVSSASILWRDRRELFSLYGYRCRHCGTVQYPRQRICYECKSRDNFEETPLYDKKGKVFTYTVDYLMASPDPPTVMTVLELENGCRFYCQAADMNPDEISLGMTMELVFRRLHSGSGIANYFWKSRRLAGELI